MIVLVLIVKYESVIQDLYNFRTLIGDITCIDVAYCYSSVVFVCLLVTHTHELFWNG